MMHTDRTYYTEKTILITGGTGYIGQSIAKELEKQSCTIKLLSRTEGDITDPDIWKQYLQHVDIIFHLAGQTSSKYSHEHPVEDLHINLLPIVRLIDAVKKCEKKPDIIFAGTSTQVGLTTETPNDETLPDRPVTVYDINKLAAEKYLLYYAGQLSGRAVSLRLTNVYGPGPASSKADRGIMNQMVKRALNGEPLTVYGAGNYIRDYIFISDVVHAFLTAGERIEDVSGDYYLIGSGVGHTIKDMMERIAKRVEIQTGQLVAVTSLPDPADLSVIEHRNFVADTRKFQTKTGWNARITLEEGIDKTIDYFHSRPS